MGYGEIIGRGRGELSRWGARTPVGLVVISWALGMVWGRYVACPLGWELGGFTLLLIAWGWGLWRWHKLETGRQWVVVLGLVGFFLGGSIWWRLDQEYLPGEHITHFMASDSETRSLVRCRVRVTSTPEDTKVAEDLPPMVVGGRKISQRWQGEVVARWSYDERGVGKWSSAVGRGWFNTSKSVPVHLGNLVEVDGWAMGWGGRELWRGGWENSGEQAYARYLAADGIFFQVTALQDFQTRVVAETDGGWLGGSLGTWVVSKWQILRSEVVERFRESLRSDGGQKDEGKLLVALLLGQRGPELAQVAQDFSDAGVAHLLAISGTHIVLVAAVIWLGLQLLLLRPRWRAPLTIVGLLIYMALTPAGPPVLRAGFATVLFLVAALLTRRPQPMNILLLVLGVVLWWRPADLYDAGCQLSFIASAGLILLGPGVHRRVFGDYLDRQAAITRAIGTRWARWWQIGREWLCRGMSANIVGALLSAPLVAFHFHQINGWAVITGLLMLPLVFLLLILGMCQLGLALVWGGGSLVGGWAATMGNWGEQWVGFLAHLPGASVTVRSPPVWWVVLVYGVVFVVINRAWLGVRRGQLVMLGMSVLVAGVGWYALTARGSVIAGRDIMQVWGLDVGKGSCLVIETAGRQHFMIDAGSTSKGNLGAQTIEPFLRRQGIGSLEGFLLTDYSFDHASGGKYVAERYRPEHLYLGWGSEWEMGRSFAESEFRGRFGSGLSKGEWVTAGDRIKMGAGGELTVLWPPPRVSKVTAKAVGMILRLDMPEHRGGLLLVSSELEVPLEWLVNQKQGLDGCTGAMVLGPVREQMAGKLVELLRLQGVEKVYYYQMDAGWMAVESGKLDKLGRRSLALSGDGSGHWVRNGE